MVTMLDVAKRAGVSKATVSRVLSNPKVVDKHTRAHVRATIEELGYRPNAVARGLASRSSRTVGVVINWFASFYYGSLLDGAEHELASGGYKMLAESARERVDGEREAWTSLLERQCDAVIIHSDNLNDDELGRWMTDHPKSVLMNRRLDQFLDRCVYLDNSRGGALAAAHLYEKGHRDIAMVTGPAKFCEVRDRSFGFIDYLQTRDLTAHVVESTFNDEGGYQAMQTVLDSTPSCSAVFFQNDEMAAGALETCRERGIDVPNDVSMIGFDDIPTARHLTPKLTTVRQPLRDIGAAAGRLALALAEEQVETNEIQRVFEAELVERGSVLACK
ncbi:LacI family DNA-binding transcriptional regulator [Ruegeria sp. SCPT10]|uniref:LacI family DNA-binding transcriptional regulator n=1 Tax=Ruegeria sp. SCP10 TaxID=3141377 RepID=UPI00333D9AEA